MFLFADYASIFRPIRDTSAREDSELINEDKWSTIANIHQRCFVFRWFLSQFLINFRDILQALFASILAHALRISWNSKVIAFDMQ